MVISGDLQYFVVVTPISLGMKKMIQMSAEDWLLVAADANHCSYGLSVQLRMPDTKSG